MNRLAIRVRLMMVFVAVMGVVLVIIGSFLYFRTRHNLDTSIAQALRARQGAARAYVQSTPRGHPPSIPPGERFAQVLTPAGTVIVSRPETLRPLLSEGQVAAAARTLHLFERHERDRFLAGPGRVNGERVVVVVGASLADHEKALEGLGGALLVGGPLALLLAAGIAYGMTAGALRPVEEMRRRAATISRADPAALLPVSEVEDELQRLSMTLNEMLGRIGRAAEHERRFIADASHELRTPLAALQAELELADRPATTAEQLRAAVTRSRGDVARLIRLSNGLLDLASVDEHHSDRFEHVDIDDLWQAIVGDLRHRSVAQDRALVVRPSGLSVRADELALRRALSNMVENALVHGTGDVSLGADLIQDSSYVELWVHDDGTLHRAVEDGKAFERFARGPDTAGRPGAGLGLALVRAVAEAHAGSAELIDEPAGGVRAVLRLPR